MNLLSLLQRNICSYLSDPNTFQHIKIKPSPNTPMSLQRKSGTYFYCFTVTFNFIKGHQVWVVEWVNSTVGFPKAKHALSPVQNILLLTRLTMKTADSHLSKPRPSIPSQSVYHGRVFSNQSGFSLQSKHLPGRSFPGQMAKLQQDHGDCPWNKNENKPIRSRHA